MNQDNTAIIILIILHIFPLGGIYKYMKINMYCKFFISYNHNVKAKTIIYSCNV